MSPEMLPKDTAKGLSPARVLIATGARNIHKRKQERMTIQITAVHKEDAWFADRHNVIGLIGKVKGRLISTGDSWYNLTMDCDGEEIGFAFCQFVVIA